jgi:hypothetical protein
MHRSKQLFDHFVGAGAHRRHGEAERNGAFPGY